MKKNNTTFTFFVLVMTFLSASFFFGLLWTSLAGAFNVVGAEESPILAVTAELPIEDASPPALFKKPQKLVIPAISVDARVEHVGVAKNGTMGIPTTFHTVGWYKYGAIPGEMGSAVVGGHADNGLGLNGVFKYLDDLQEGDEIYVYDSDNTEVRFVVSGVDSYDYKDVPTDMIFNENEAPLLRLITCDGKWVWKDKTYDTRIIVTAELAP
ncbi:MAG: class F sortase [bacterium]|nr:class F sortase [bacterium]